MMQFGQICCVACPEGSVVTKMQNVTRVHNVTNATPPISPFPRLSASLYNGVNVLGNCATMPLGQCGTWQYTLGGAISANSPSEQEITDTVNDIIACGGGITPSDNNCYQANGTIDLTTNQRFGGRWLFARKFWHGIFGMIDRDDPHIITGSASTVGAIGSGGGIWSNTFTDDPSAITYPIPPQIKYRTINANVSSSETHYDSSGNIVTQYTDNPISASSVNQAKGIITTTGSNATTYPSGFGTTAAEAWFGNLTTWDEADIFGYFQNWTASAGGVDTLTIASAGAGSYTMTGITTSGDTQTLTIQNITCTKGYMRMQLWAPQQLGDGSWITLLTNDIEMTYSNVGASITLTQNTWQSSGSNFVVDNVVLVNGTVGYSDPYTSADCMADLYTLMKAWPLDSAAYPWRTDEELANAPLIIYDEVQNAVAPSPSFNPTMNNYTAPQNGDGSWPQWTWVDPNDYYWTSPTGGLVDYGTDPTNGWPNPAGGNHYNHPIFTGEIISNNPAGFDIHFWFNAQNYERVLGTPSQWHLDSTGGWTDSNLPKAAMRWLNKEAAQYDSENYTLGQEGMWPGSFVHQIGGCVTACKYVQATQPWQAVNYARPCGADKYDVDQQSVCCYTGSGASGGNLDLTGVTVTGNAAAPLTTGGLQANDYISIDGIGIYKISSIGGTGPWTIYCTTNTPIEALPGGFTMSSDGIAYTDGTHVGRLRFYSTAAATCTGALNTTASQRTAVHLEWTFNPRAANWATPPTWYAGVTGCLGCSVNQFNYGSGSCRAVVGIVPFYSSSPAGGGVPTGGGSPPAAGPAESFTNQSLYQMPDTFQFDDHFGAHWQGWIALTMPDPFWETPFKPNCNVGADSGDGFGDPIPDFAWVEDDGCSRADVIDPVTGYPTTRYYPHHPLVEASSVPAHSLPSGVYLFYDPAHNSFAPPYYPYGIPIGDDTGDYGSVATDWGFASRACTSIAESYDFADFYATFVNCASVPTGTC